MKWNKMRKKKKINKNNNKKEHCWLLEVAAYIESKA